MVLPIVASAQQSLVDKYPLTPQPQEAIFGQSELKFESFDLVENDFPQLIEHFSEFLRSNEIPKTASGLKIRLINDSRIGFNNIEGYYLEIGKEVSLKANNVKGAFYRLQTLKQLIILVSGKTLPQHRIKDFPAFKIRGFFTRYR